MAPTLKEINDRVFDFLLERHYQAKEQGIPDSFLFVMTTDEYRLAQGLWLPGDAESIWVSFLTRAGREAAVYLRISDTSTTPVSLLLKSSEQLDNALKLAPIVAEVSLATQLNLSPVNFGNNEYSRTYQAADYIVVLSEFITNEKDKINSTVLHYRDLLTDRSFSLGQPIELRQFYEQFQRVQRSRLMVSLPAFDNSESVFCALHYLHVRNFRGIRDLTISNLPNSVKWLFLTGENGFGKTSVLQAIAVGLLGVPGQIDKEFSTATIECIYSSIADPVYNDISCQRYTFSSLPWLEGHVAAYGSSRLQTSRIAALPSDDPKLATLYHLFYPDGELLDVEQWLIEWNKYREKDYDYIIKILKFLLPTLHDIRINYPYVDYYEKDEEGNPFAKGTSFKQLAAGFRNVIALICDILRRLWEEGRGEYEDLIEGADGMHFLSLAGIVIIDEFELHLHPKYQRELPKKLSILFPNVQFIVSTHSPIPLLGAPKESIVLTVHRTEETGITVERLDIDFSKLLPNAILTSPIFGFDDIIPESAENIADVETEDSYDAAVANERLKKKLKILKAKLNTD